MAKIEIEKIVTTAGTQMRVQIDNDVVEDYRQADNLPPVDVFRDPESTEEVYYLADGFHRLEAKLRDGVKFINAIIHSGSLREAILFAAGANADHGLRRSNEDKRRAVSVLLKDPEWMKWSDREIARQCGVHGTFVGKCRKILTAVDSSEDKPRTYTTKHGTVAEMKTANIGQPSPAELEEIADLKTKYQKKISGGITFNVDEFEDEPVSESPEIVDSLVVTHAVESRDPAEIHLAQAKLLRDQLGILRRRVADTQKEVQGFAQSELGAHLQEYEQSLKNAFDTVQRYLKSTEPYCQCFRCGGIGCPVCKQRGWMDRTQHDSRNAPPDVTLI